MPRELWEAPVGKLLVTMHERAREITRLSLRIEDMEREVRRAGEEAAARRQEEMEWKAVATTQAAILARLQP